MLGAAEGARWSADQGRWGALLAHPLTLPLVAAAVSGLLFPRLTQQWQDHQQEVETRGELAARVSRTVGEITVATQLAQVGAPSQTQEDAARRERYLRGVHADLGLPDDVDLVDAEALRAALLSERDRVIKEVLDRDMQ